MKIKMFLSVFLCLFMFGCTAGQYPFLADLKVSTSLEGNVDNYFRDTNVMSFDVDDQHISIEGIDFSDKSVNFDYVRVKRVERPMNVSAVINAFGDDELVMVYVDNIEPDVYFMDGFRVAAGIDFVSQVDVANGYKWVSAKLIDPFNSIVSLNPGVVTKVKHNGEIWNFLLLGAMARLEGSDAATAFMADILIYK